jgi:hypothetical protein
LVYNAKRRITPVKTLPLLVWALLGLLFLNLLIAFLTLAEIGRGAPCLSA